MSNKQTTREHGVQPLDTILDKLALENSDLVAASTEQLTHKQVQKARKGRLVTANIQRKILTALQTASGAANEHRYSREELFGYRP